MGRGFEAQVAHSRPNQSEHPLTRLPDLDGMGCYKWIMERKSMYEYKRYLFSEILKLIKNL